MKKLLKIIGLLLLLVIAFVLIGGLFIKKDYHIEREIIINAPKEKVWSHVKSLQAFAKWNPFLEKDPNVKVNFTGQEGAIGSVYEWDGNSDVGKGSQTITVADSSTSSFKSHLHFIKPFEGDAEGYVKLADAGSNTKVSWGFDSKYKYPMNVMTLFMDGMMKEVFDKGLGNLKKIAEAK